MYRLQTVLCSEDISTNDDIDRLFSKLEQIEPPTTLVDNILASVAQLARKQSQQSTNVWSQAYDFIVHNEDRDPS